MTDHSVAGVLRERASLQPDDVAFTFVDYERDWNGVAVTLTWSQLYRRTHSLAYELRQHAAIGDRAVILAPQGLEYVVAFLASLQAGIIAVPLSVPMIGAHDERVTAVLQDARPTVLLTTSAAASQVVEYAVPQGDQPAPAVIEVDSMDLDSRRKSLSRRETRPATAYLQYTSGSTRTPAGVMVSDTNLMANYEQLMANYFPESGGVAPPNTTVVSWLPFYHDMGLMLGMCAPILGGWHTVFTTPLSFLARPARWIQLLASYPNVLTAAPNFAFDLAVGKTSDADMAGLDLTNVLLLISGSERVHEATLRRFSHRFGRFNLRHEALQPSYGLAEATLFVATRTPGQVANIVGFEPEKLSVGHAKRCANATGTQLISYGTPETPVVRIVDPDSTAECLAGTIGEIWVHGENVCLGYWERPEQTEHTFGATIAASSVGTPQGSWLRTGDLGFISDGELFIIGRLKDLLIVRGRNHYPDDIEATVQEITGCRSVAISVYADGTEQLVAILEIKQRGSSKAERSEELLDIMSRVTSAVSRAHGIKPADLVLVSRGSIPITTSGKVRRQSCVELYEAERFTRLDGEPAVSAEIA